MKIILRSLIIVSLSWTTLYSSEELTIPSAYSEIRDCCCTIPTRQEKQKFVRAAAIVTSLYAGEAGIGIGLNSCLKFIGVSASAALGISTATTGGLFACTAGTLCIICYRRKNKDEQKLIVDQQPPSYDSLVNKPLADEPLVNEN